MSEHEELAQWLDEEAKRCAAQFHDRIARAAALLRQPAPAPVPGWQPISTAPRDGTEILASDYDAIEIVSWSWDAWGNRDGSIMFPAWWQPLPDHPPIPQPPQGGEVEPAPATDTRNPECVAAWPECYDGGYDPSCCRFPKSCSCGGQASPQHYPPHPQGAPDR